MGGLSFISFALAGFDLMNPIANKLNIELPLVDAEGIAVDSSNNVYVGSPFYGIIQVYDKNGEFIKNWGVITYGGGFSIDILENETIAIYPYRSSEEIIYNNKGQLIAKKKVERNIERNDSKNTYMTKARVKYEIYKWLYPKIKKDNLTFINQNILLKMLTMPLSINIAILSFIILIIINKKKWNEVLKKYKINEILTNKNKCI